MSDSDGYPTEEELETIRNWNIIGKKEAKQLMEYVQSIWNFGDEYFKVKDANNSIYYILHTGGWSGNEDIIGALQENIHCFWLFYWLSTRRGGHYIFKIRNDIGIL